MIKIYLDQKDFIDIAEGLLGKPEYKESVECYNYLIPLVESGDIRIYYSWCHLYESLKYHKEGSRSLELQCDVFEKLTQGHCLLPIQEIIKREIEIFLSSRFSYRTSLSVENYPYGKYSDCVTFDVDIKSPHSFPIKKLSNKQRKTLIRKIDNLSKKELTKLILGFESLTKEELKSLFTENENIQQTLTQKLMDNIFNFKDLILRYRKTIRQLDNIRNQTLNRSKEFVGIVAANREHQLEKEESVITEQFLTTTLLDVYKKGLGKLIQHLLDKGNLSLDKAAAALGNFNDITGIRFYNELLIEYFKRNSGKTDKTRITDDHDHLDIEHMRNLPYVDIYITDKFFYGVAESISQPFETHIIRNLQTLKSYLEEIL